MARTVTFKFQTSDEELADARQYLSSHKLSSKVDLNIFVRQRLRFPVDFACDEQYLLYERTIPVVDFGLCFATCVQSVQDVGDSVRMDFDEGAVLIELALAAVGEMVITVGTPARDQVRASCGAEELRDAVVAFVDELRETLAKEVPGLADVRHLHGWPARSALPPGFGHCHD